MSLNSSSFQFHCFLLEKNSPTPFLLLLLSQSVSQSFFSVPNSPGRSFYSTNLGSWHLRTFTVLGSSRGLYFSAKPAARDESTGAWNSACLMVSADFFKFYKWDPKKIKRPLPKSCKDHHFCDFLVGDFNCDTLHCWKPATAISGQKNMQTWWLRTQIRQTCWVKLSEVHQVFHRFEWSGNVMECFCCFVCFSFRFQWFILLSARRFSFFAIGYSSCWSCSNDGSRNKNGLDPSVRVFLVRFEEDNMRSLAL